MAFIFELSVYVSFLAFTLFGLCIYCIGYSALHILSHHAKNDILSVPIGAFVSTIATAWALSLGFVAADIWAANSKADQATSEERSSISRLIGAASPEILHAPELAATLIEYRQAVVKDEWENNSNIEPAHSVEVALQNIRREIVDLAKTSVPTPIISQLVHDFDELQDARNTRLSVGATSVDMYKWYLLMALTVLTVITIASTHADRARAGVKAIIIYSITAAFCLWILAIHANPYQGIERLEPSQLFTNQKHGQSTL
ncbi:MULTISPECIES: hypothetical protein [Brucella/Ochrobactrum group]|uniref:bestrophin-like domain n=1 Tax=Brucella/Ochrobactrum group TaxID=2826938 RepID=UPI001654E4D7|nr:MULTISPECIES: hypothetical protein [Brucella/Ochrobactrum group]MBC8717065.1 hypothetical protein [Ochrobactrum sp. Marseille-Q0166]